MIVPKAFILFDFSAILFYFIGWEPPDKGPQGNELISSAFGELLKLKEEKLKNRVVFKLIAFF